MASSNPFGPFPFADRDILQCQVSKEAKCLWTKSWVSGLVRPSFINHNVNQDLTMPTTVAFSLIYISAAVLTFHCTNAGSPNKPIVELANLKGKCFIIYFYGVIEWRKPVDDNWSLILKKTSDQLRRLVVPHWTSKVRLNLSGKVL